MTPFKSATAGRERMESNKRLKVLDILDDIRSALLQHRYGDIYISLDKAEEVLEEVKP